MNNIKHYAIPVLVFLSGIFLSVISAYYSILGLLSIFTGATLLIALMGGGLEFAKIAGCIWLHKHWNDKIGFLRVYLSIAIIILLLITSMGIFGFLSKSSLTQSDSVNLNSAKVTYLEDTIKREQSKVDSNSVQINQYNLLLSKLIATDIRTASNERKRIQSEILVLNKESKESIKTIDNLNTELLPYKSEIKGVEVEVGTLLYVSKLIYGNEYKEHITQTLTILSLMIIFVFDPLAIGLLIASQKSFQLISINKKDEEDKLALPREQSKVEITTAGDTNIMKPILGHTGTSSADNFNDNYIKSDYRGATVDYKYYDEEGTIDKNMWYNTLNNYNKRTNEKKYLKVDNEELNNDVKLEGNDTNIIKDDDGELDLFGGKSSSPFDYYEPGIDDEYDKLDEQAQYDNSKVTGRLPKKYRQATKGQE